MIDKRLRGRPKMGWMDSVMRVLDTVGIFLEQRGMLVHDRN